jgi:hypothetical protein
MTYIITLRRDPGLLSRGSHRKSALADLRL